MNYTSIDSTLNDWSSRHHLQLYTSYQDTEVRTVFIEGAGEERSQIWIDAPDANDKVLIHVAVYRKRGRDNQQRELLATTDNLNTVLEQAYSTAIGWLGGLEEKQFQRRS